MNPLTLIVPAKSEASTEIVVDPMYVDKAGLHIVNVKVMPIGTMDSVTYPLKVTIEPTEFEKREYIPSILVDVKMEELFDPRDSIPVRIEIKNLNPLDMPDFKVKVESNLINKEFSEELLGNQQKVIEFTAELSDKTVPQKDQLIVSFLKNNSDIHDPVKKVFEIVKYLEIEKSETQARSFMRADNVVTFTNKGNVEYAGTLDVETAFVRRMFTTTTPEGKYVQKDGKLYFEWDAAIASESSKTVTLTVNYRPLLYLIILSIIIVLLYFQLRTPLVLTKAAATIEKREGGIAGLKIQITVKNRGQKALHNIELSERASNIVDVVEDLSLGTLKPLKVLRHEKKGSIIVWQIEKLEKDEERVITYKVKAKLPILGGISIDPTRSTFKYMGQGRTAYSNRLNVVIQG